MPDYKTMYLDLFNSVTDAIEILCEAQRKAEETFIDTSEKDGEKIRIIDFRELAENVKQTAE